MYPCEIITVQFAPFVQCTVELLHEIQENKDFRLAFYCKECYDANDI